MKSKKTLIILATIAIAVVVFNTVFMILDAFFYNMNDLPQGTAIATYESPDKENKINVYVVKNSLGNAVRCELDGKRNIYWVTDIENAEVNWVDNNVVTINGISLDIESGSHDCRKINEKLEIFLANNIF